MRKFSGTISKFRHDDVIFVTKFCQPEEWQAAAGSSGFVGRFEETIVGRHVDIGRGRQRCLPRQLRRRSVLLPGIGPERHPQRRSGVGQFPRQSGQAHLHVVVVGGQDQSLRW